MSSNNGSRLRGGTTIVPQNAEYYSSVDRYRDTYRAQAQAREELKREKLLSGGDESVFSGARELYDNIPDAEPIEFSPSGLTLNTGSHRISGPAGKGKTRIGYSDLIKRIEAGQAWMIIDAEMGAVRFKQAMRQLGALRDHFDSMYYMDAYAHGVPDMIEHGSALMRMIERHGYDGVLYDSQVTMLGASGLSENDAVDVRNWTMRACSGVGCAIILDHTGNSDTSRGRGTSDKAAGCDVDMFMRVEYPFSIGNSGQVSLTVNKDRSGTLATGTFLPIEVECYDDGGMEFVPGEWDVPEQIEEDVAEALQLAMIKNERDYANAGELQAVLHGAKDVRIGKIKMAVRNGIIMEEGNIRNKRYTLP